MTLAQPLQTTASPLDPERCYRALSARDPRFDGVFFVGVTTTGIYCRPICPARRPAAARCRYFARAAEAEREGFRACLRCRPELAPGLSPMDAQATLARTAAARIEDGYLDEAGVDALAAELGVTARHLRRAIAAELGVSPLELAQSRRLATAKQLLQDTRLPLAEVAFAAGFASIRRFNAAFRARFGCAPSALRRPAPRDHAEAGSITLRLDYRPPLAWDALLAFLGARAIPGVEAVRDGVYRRTVALGERRGWVCVRQSSSALAAEVALPLVPAVLAVVRRLRRVFDLDAEPAAIAEQLGADRLLEPLVQRHPGLRVPGAFDGFETAVRAILGQQVSVSAATTLCGRLVGRFGEPAPWAPPGLGALFPTPAVLAAASIDDLAGIGLPGRRAATIQGLARAVAAGRVTLDPTRDAAAQLAELRQIPGIGEWTADYIALRALHLPDAFPAGDLGLRRALRVETAAAAQGRAEPWRPWRAYAAIYLWHSLSQGG